MIGKLVSVPARAKERTKNLSYTLLMPCRYLDLVRNQRIFYSNLKVVTK